MSGNSEGRSTGGLENAEADVDTDVGGSVSALGKHLRRKAKFIGMVVALALTTYVLWTVDDNVSTDVIVFAALTVVMVVYLLITLRSDVRIE